MKKNHAIEIYRYFFAIFVCTLHFKEYYGKPYPFGGAYLSVEFFLILAGFFEMKHIWKSQNEASISPEQSTITYFWSRIKRLYPQYAVSLLLLYIYRIFINQKITLKSALVDYLPEWGMVQILGFGKFLNSAMWYVSAMFVASLIIYYLAVKNKRKFVFILAPIIVVVIYSWFYQDNHSLAGIGLKTRSFLVCDGLWRALAGMALGSILYVIYDKYKDWISEHLKVLRTLGEILILGLICYLFYGPGCTVKDFTLVILMCLFILSVMSGGSYLTILLNKIPVKGKYTYALYCNHWLFNYIFKEYFAGHSFYPTLILYIGVSFIMSVLTTALIDFMWKQVDKIKAKNQSTLIQR